MMACQRRIGSKVVLLLFLLLTTALVSELQRTARPEQPESKIQHLTFTDDRDKVQVNKDDTLKLDKPKSNFDGVRLVIASEQQSQASDIEQARQLKGTMKGFKKKSDSVNINESGKRKGHDDDEPLTLFLTELFNLLPPTTTKSKKGKGVNQPSKAKCKGSPGIIPEIGCMKVWSTGIKKSKKLKHTKKSKKSSNQNPTVSPSYQLPPQTSLLPSTILPTTFPTSSTPSPISLPPSKFQTPALAPASSIPSKIPLVPSNFPAPSSSPLITNIPKYYVALAAPGAKRAPTAEEYAGLLNFTNAYFTEVLKQAYANNTSIHFIQTQSMLNTTKFGAGIPEQRFNIYFELLTKALYAAGSMPPTAAEQYAILKASIGPQYISAAANTLMGALIGTPFETVNETVSNLVVP